MKLIRTLLVFVILTSSLGIAALWVFTNFIEPDAFRNLAKKQLSSVTHLDSTIEGPVNWRIFPKPGLHVHKVRIGNIDEKQTDYGLQVGDLIFHLQFKPLLHGKLVFDKLIFNDFTLRVNFDSVKTSSKSQPLPEQKAQQNTKASTKKKSFMPSSRIALKSLLLSNGKIILTQKEEVLTLKNVRIETLLPDVLQDEFPIQLKATISKPSGATPLSGVVAYKGLMTLPALDKTPNITEKVKVNGQLLLQDIKLGEYAISQANAHVFFKDDKLELNPLTLKLYQGESVGRLTYALKTSDLTFQQTGTGLNAEPVFQKLVDIRPSRLSGALDFSTQIKATLNQPNWHKKIKTNGSFTLKEGTISYIDIPQITKEATETIQALASRNIDNLQLVLEKLKPWSLSQYQGSTSFQLLNIKYHTDDNAFLHYQLMLETKKLHLKGQGSLQLETHALNARLKAHILTNDPSIQAAENLLDGFPLVVTGTLEKPIIAPDKPLIRRLLTSGEVPRELLKTLKGLKQQIKHLRE